MANKKKFKKIKMPKALTGAGEYFTKRLPGIIITVVFLILASVLITAFFERSDYFRVRYVEVRGASGASIALARTDILRNYKDKNIFKINIGAIANGLESKYPDAKEIIVKRVLPDKLLLDLRFRKPAAILSNGQIFVVDREGVVLVNADAARLSDLPVIKGIDTRFAGKPHKKNESRNLMFALDLIDEIKRSAFLERYRVRVIDAGDLKSMSFNLGDTGPAVIIGYEDFKYRLNVLKDTLRDPRLVPENISYIDVRFKDVAIGPK